MKNSVMSEGRLCNAAVSLVLAAALATTGVVTMSSAYAEESVVEPIVTTDTVGSVLTSAEINEGLTSVIDAQKKAVEEKERAEAEAAAAAARAAASYSSDSSGVYNSGVVQSGQLTRSGGVFDGPSGKETWYSQKKLPGGGLDIPGRHVREDGVIVDVDGYVVVALPSGEKGKVVETSLGTAKCYDTNAGGNSVDVYVNW